MLQRKTLPDYKSFGMPAIWIEALMLFYVWFQERASSRKTEPLLMSNRLPLEICHRKESLSMLNVVTKLIFLSIELLFFMIHFTNAWTTLTREPSFSIFRWKPRWNWKSIKSEIASSFYFMFHCLYFKSTNFCIRAFDMAFRITFPFSLGLIFLCAELNKNLNCFIV